MTRAPERGTMIGRLRVRAAARDATALRMQSEAILRSDDLQPASLPPQAILCIRSLRDPLPGLLDLTGRDSASRVLWHRAVRAAIERLAQRAIRAANQSVPASAEAVLFIDRAEMLACAARDAVHGALVDSWWWPRLLNVNAGLASVVREWTREPRCIPAALTMLARRRGDLLAMARSIARDDARRILEAILLEHGLPSLAAAIARARTPRARIAVTSFEPVPQWLDMVPEASEPSLDIEQQLFVLLPLLLQRAPAIVRTASFETTIARWIATQNASASQPRSAGGTSPPRRRLGQRRAVTQRSRWRQPPADENPKLLATNAEQTSETAAAQQKRIELAVPQPVPLADLPREDDLLDLPPLLQTEFTSQFAGALFLFNAGIALGFYSDFTSPVQRGIGLDVFLFVDRVARALAGRAFARDPIHHFLRSSALHASRWTPPRVLAAYPNAPRRDRWIAAVANHLRLRLGAKLARQLVALPGRITVSLLHLDAHFSIETHPIEIRIAGLDRNPGWIPAAGRHVAFHFD